MAKRRRQTKIPTPAWERPRGTIGRRILGRGSQFYGAVAVGLLILVALGIVGYAFGADELEKRGRPGSTAIQVGETSFRLDYFSRRLRMFVAQNGGQGSVQPINAVPAVSSLLIREEIVRRFAGELDISATEDEIQAEIANRLGIQPDDETFDTVFQQELLRTELSEQDYRDMIEADVLISKLQDKFREDVPESEESVRFRQILVSDQATADDLVQQIKNGGDFAALAAENSLDTGTKDSGGEVDWTPRGIMDSQTEEQVFNLQPGEVTTVSGAQGVLIVQLLEKDDDHAVSEDFKPRLANNLLNDWVQEKGQSLDIVNNMDVGGGGDGKKINWAVQHAYRS